MKPEDIEAQLEAYAPGEWHKDCGAWARGYADKRLGGEV